MPEKKQTKKVWHPADFKSQSRIQDEIDAVDADIRECFSNTRNMERGYKI